MNANDVINPVVIIPKEDVDIDVAVKVQIAQVENIINEYVARVQIEEAKIANPAPVDVAYQ